MNTPVIFNYSLLLDEPLAADLVEASQNMAEGRNFEYVLGEESLPHVTILQFHGFESEAPAIWDKLQSLQVPPIHLHFQGLGLDRFQSWDVVWLRLKHCSPLRALQGAALKLFPDRKFVNGLGDAYEPHATLGTWRIQPNTLSLPIPTKILDRNEDRPRLALGVSGPQFQFARVLFGEGHPA